MKLQTRLTEAEIRQALALAQEAGDVADHIEFDQFSPAGSRTRQHGWDVHLGTRRRDSRVDGKLRPVAAYYGVHGQLKAATYDEWGHFLAELFGMDEDAIAGPYKGREDFHAKTAYAYASGMDEMPADTAPDDPEPYRGDPDTAPTSDAMVPEADRTLGRIDDALAVYRTWHRAHP